MSNYFQLHIGTSYLIVLLLHYLLISLQYVSMQVNEVMKQNHHNVFCGIPKAIFNQYDTHTDQLELQRFNSLVKAESDKIKQRITDSTADLELLITKQFKGLADTLLSKVNTCGSSSLQTLHVINDALEHPLAEQLGAYAPSTHGQELFNKLMQDKPSTLSIFMQSQENMVVRILSAVTLSLFCIIFILLLK